MPREVEEPNAVLADLEWIEVGPGYLYKGPREKLPEVKFRWDVDWGEARIMSRPTMYFKGFPPRLDESTFDYMERMLVELPRPWAAPARLYRTRWWQFWRERRN